VLTRVPLSWARVRRVRFVISRHRPRHPSGARGATVAATTATPTSAAATATSAYANTTATAVATASRRQPISAASAMQRRWVLPLRLLRACSGCEDAVRGVYVPRSIMALPEWRWRVGQMRVRVECSATAMRDCVPYSVRGTDGTCAFSHV
jgi:type IV secretory pathway TrbL component